MNDIQFTVEDAQGNKMFVFIDFMTMDGDVEPPLEFSELSKHGVMIRRSTAKEIKWYDDPEFDMDGDDEPCYCYPDELESIILTVKDW